MDTTKQKKYAKYALVACAAVQCAFVGIAYMTMSLYAASIVEELHILRTQYMVVPSMIAGISGVVNFFVFGPATKRYGVKKFLLFSSVISVLGYASIAMAQNVFMLWLGGFLAGFGMGGVNGTMINTIVLQWYTKGQARYVSIACGTGAVAGIIASSVWGRLIEMVGWRIPMWVTVGIGIAACIAVEIFYKGSPRENGLEPLHADNSSTEHAVNDEEDGISAKAMWRTPQFILMSIAYVLFAGAVWSVYNNMALLMSDAGFGANTGMLLSLALITQALGFYILAPIADKFGSRWLITLGLLLLLGGILIFNLPQVKMALCIAAAIMVGFASGCVQVPYGVSVREAFGRKEYNMKVGVIAGFVDAGACFGPILVTATYDMSGSYTMGLIACAIAAVVTIVLIFPATKRVKG